MQSEIIEHNSNWLNQNILPSCSTYKYLLTYNIQPDKSLPPFHAAHNTYEQLNITHIKYV